MSSFCQGHSWSAKEIHLTLPSAHDLYLSFLPTFGCGCFINALWRTFAATRVWLPISHRYNRMLTKAPVQVMVLGAGRSPGWQCHASHHYSSWRDIDCSILPAAGVSAIDHGDGGHVATGTRRTEAERRPCAHGSSDTAAQPSSAG